MERRNESVHWLTPQVFATARAGPDLEARSPNSLPVFQVGSMSPSILAAITASQDEC